MQQYIDEGRKHVIRFKLDDRPITFKDLTVGMHSSNPGRNEGDFIIVKSDGYPTYHFAHVVDDHLMRVSHVLRGQEWLLSTPKHIAIFDAFGWKPPQYGKYNDKNSVSGIRKSEKMFQRKFFINSRTSPTHLQLRRDQNQQASK